MSIKIEPPSSTAWTDHTHDDRYYTEAETDAKYALLATSINTTAPLAGGGTLAATRTLTLSVDSNDLGVDGSNQLYVKDGGIDHGSLAALTDDDHAQYALLAGRTSGGGASQTLIGSIDASGDLGLRSSSNATKGRILFGLTNAYDEQNGQWGFGIATGMTRFVDINNDSYQEILRLESGHASGVGLELEATGTGGLRYGIYSLADSASQGGSRFLIYDSENGKNLFCVLGVNTGLAGVVTPTAYLHLPAGTATAGTAPIKLTTGTNLTAAEAGAIEFDGTNFYFTDSVPTRRTLSVVGHVHAAGDITTGTLATARGGTNADSSAWSGMVKTVTGTWSAVTGTSGYPAYWSDANTVAAEQYLAVSRGGIGVGTLAVNGILYGNTTSAVQATTAAASSVLVTNGSNVPSLATDIPTAVTIGAAYIYRVSGTDVAVADGGTGKSSWTQYSIPYASTTAVISEIAPAASSILITSAGSVPSLATDIPTAVTIGSAYVYRVGGTDVAVADGGTGGSAASITLFNNITGYTATGATGATSTNLVFSASPTITGTMETTTTHASTILVDHIGEHGGGHEVVFDNIATFINSGLHVLDTNASHDLIITPGSDLTADRILTLTTGDAARTITLSGNPTLNDWFDQNVKTTGTPQFANIGIAVAANATYGVFVSSSSLAYGAVAAITTASGSCYGFDALVSGAATSNFGLYVGAKNATNNYAIYVPATWPSADTNNYAIYSAATAKSYFAGSVNIQGNSVCLGTYISVYTDEISEYVTNANAALYINYRGYGTWETPGATQFRDLFVGNGRQSNTPILFVDGSTQLVGINTYSPSTYLHGVPGIAAYGSTSSGISLANDGTSAIDWLIYGNNDVLYFYRSHASHAAGHTYFNVTNLGICLGEDAADATFRVQCYMDMGKYVGFGRLTGHTDNYYTSIFSTGTYLYFDVNGTYAGYMDSTSAITPACSRSRKIISYAYGEEVLPLIDKIPVYVWRGTQPENVDYHIGPVAEEWNEVLHHRDELDDMHRNMIATGDVAGLSLAGVKALISKLEKIEKRLEKLEAHD